MAQPCLTDSELSPKSGKCPTSDPTFSDSLGLPRPVTRFTWSPLKIHHPGLRQKKVYNEGGFAGLGGIATIWHILSPTPCASKLP